MVFITRVVRHFRFMAGESNEISYGRDLWQRLRLAINKIIHDHDIMVGCFQDPVARGNSHEEDARCIKCDSQERKASAPGRSGQYVLAEQQVTVNIEVFDHRAIVRIHVGEDSAEPL